MTAGGLIAADDSLLIVIDAQPGFLDRLETEAAETIAARIGWLVRVADHLGIAVLATEEEPDRNGNTHPLIAAALPAGVLAKRKDVFGLADQDDIMAEVTLTGRRTAILVGLETDVCVAHSALGLDARGYRVVVVADATGSPAEGHPAGLERLRQAGLLVTTTKAIFYEWVRTVAQARAVEAAIRPPAGLGL